MSKYLSYTTSNEETRFACYNQNMFSFKSFCSTIFFSNVDALFRPNWSELDGVQIPDGSNFSRLLRFSFSRED